MRPENKSKTNIGIALSLPLQFVGVGLFESGGLLAVFGVVILAFAVAALIWGCMSYAEGKGYSKWLGLLGLLSLPGLIILFMFPDHYKGARW